MQIGRKRQRERERKWRKISTSGGKGKYVKSEGNMTGGRENGEAKWRGD